MTPWNENFIDSAFTYHEPKDGQPEMYAAIRAKAGELAALICELCPSTAETTLALRKVQEAVMWANASIALDGHVAEVKTSQEQPIESDARKVIARACDTVYAVAWALDDQGMPSQHELLRLAVEDIREALRG